MPQQPAIRDELHFGGRVVRCFAERPAHIDAMVRETVARHPQREAFALGDTRITWRMLDAAVEAVAGNLAARGFRKGDRLALLIGNRLEFVYCLLAAARIGVIAVPMNIRQRRPEIEFVLNQCEAAGLVYDADIAGQLPPRAAVPSLREVFVVGGGDGTAFDVLAGQPRRRPATSPRKTFSACSTPPAPPVGRRAPCSRIWARSTRCCISRTVWSSRRRRRRSWRCPPRHVTGAGRGDPHHDPRPAAAPC